MVPRFSMLELLWDWNREGVLEDVLSVPKSPAGAGVAFDSPLGKTFFGVGLEKLKIPAVGRMGCTGLEAGGPDFLSAGTGLEADTEGPDLGFDPGRSTGEAEEPN